MKIRLHSFRRIRCLGSLIAVGLIPTAISVLQAEPPTELAEAGERVWHSNDGRALRATLLDLNAKARTVRMRREDGYHFTLPWSDFSEANQAYFEKQAARDSDPDSDAAGPPMEPSAKASEPATRELPRDIRLRKVPMIVQKGAFCVPASAAMIAGFHGLKVTQEEVAQLSSESSISNTGTLPSDMLLAMEKLGFTGRPLYWQGRSAFFSEALSEIKTALVDTGPIYISFEPGVFGIMGHGCVIVGYDDRREEMHFYNPWGDTFSKPYDDVATQARGIVLIYPPEPAPVATGEFIEKFKQILPQFDGEDMIAIHSKITKTDQAATLLWCSRRDSLEDRRFAVDTARKDGRKILKLAFDRNPAALIPFSPNGKTEKILFVTRPAEGGSRFLVREISRSGWSAPELRPLGQLTREWPTRFDAGTETDIWELPLIELGE